MGGANIDLLLVGVSHRTAPVAVRERLAVEPDAVAAALAELTALSAVREAAMISTCNRVELYVAADDADRAAAGLAERARAAGRRRGRRSRRAPLPAPRRRRRSATCSGSPPASIRWWSASRRSWARPSRRYDAAVQHGTAGAVLRACFEEGAFRVARRVRRETAIARNPVSVSSVAVEFARQVVGDFARRRVLIVGAGKMSELAARTLRTHGATLTVTNRTRARAEELAQRFGADVADWNDLRGALAAADIVIASTGAQRPVLTLDLLTQVRKARRGRPLCLLDIAVPRDVEPAAGEAGRHLPVRHRRPAEAGERRTAPSAKRRRPRPRPSSSRSWARFVKRWRSRQLGPMVSALQTHFHGIAQRRGAARCRAGVDEKEREGAPRPGARACVKKLLHLPHDRAARRRSRRGRVAGRRRVQRLFALSPVAAVPARRASAPGESRPSNVDKKAAGS